MEGVAEVAGVGLDDVAGVGSGVGLGLAVGVGVTEDVGEGDRVGPGDAGDGTAPNKPPSGPLERSADRTGPSVTVAMAAAAAAMRISAVRRTPARRTGDVAMQRAPYLGAPAGTIPRCLPH
jgi:hypothetical protein